MNMEINTPRTEDVDFGWRKNPGYHHEIYRTYRHMIPEGTRVLELGCGSGRLLASLKPAEGVGLDRNPEAIRVARELHAGQPGLTFDVADVQSEILPDRPPFDYIILSDLVMHLADIQQVLKNLQAVCNSKTRIVLNYPSNLWRPAFLGASLIGRKKRDPFFNWLSTNDINNLLYLSDYEVITRKGRILCPLKIPFLAGFLNRFLAKMPLLNLLSLSWFAVARPRPRHHVPVHDAFSVSVLIPTRDEKGNIEEAFRRTPHMGAWTELVFVDGNSTDGTVEEIHRCIEKYREQWPRVKFMHQTGKGKGQAVRQGFDACEGDILMILDSDLTMPPEDLPKFYDAIASGHGEFVNGCRLVYPMEKKAMRFLNMIANHFFALLFTWLLDQPVKDTLCGTKVLWRKDYLDIAANRSYFGDFDPFGDFDLLFGAARLNRKIVDLPVRYRERTYGEIKIQRWRHGLLLFQMSFVAFSKLKLKT